MKKIKEEALDYHRWPKPGKIETVPTKRYSTQRDLSLAYSPGVAEPCLEIKKRKENVYEYTSKGNLVAVISNGTAVLGLGNIGPEASKPVMEGKGLLFKIFADIDVFDIEIDALDPDKFVETVKAIYPTFGGINLEDIKSPEAFEIEKRLKRELDIPVMHDDQHGTAIISAAALKNALEIVKKEIEKVRIVVNGAGAAAISCVHIYMRLGAKKENIVMCDSKGVIRTDRENLSKEKSKFATDLDFRDLEEAIKGSDVFIGLSVANSLSPEMLLSMNENPIVFAMANPNPEIDYNLATQTRKDVIMATGRSDHPNQVNNVLVFPFIFRGALDVRSKEINEEMKMAAVYALSKLAKERVPNQVNIAYNKKNISFGKEYIIPKPFDERLITTVSLAVAKAAMESGVARNPITDWGKYEEELRLRIGNDERLIRMIQTRAKTDPKRIVFTNGYELDILKAAEILRDDVIAYPILLGNEKEILNKIKFLKLDFEFQIIDPKSPDTLSMREEFAQKFWKKCNRKGITLRDARRKMREHEYFGAMMVQHGKADALIAGYTKNYAESLRPLLRVFDLQKGIRKIASMMIMITNRGPLFLADTAIIPNPTKEDFIDLAKMTSYVVRQFGIRPKIAFLSYSNFGSSEVGFNKDMRNAIAHLHKNNPNILVDGELQSDFALNQKLLNDRFPFSKLCGNPPNVFIFPNLESSNIAYKMIRELNKIPTIGPIILGLNKPAHIMQLQAGIQEIINMATLAVVDAQRSRR